MKLSVEEASNINLMNILTNSLHREHCDVLRKLETALAETTEFPAIGKAFQFGKPSAKFHQSFGKCYQIWTSTVENNRGKGLDAWLEQHKVQDMDLSSWFIRVVQRPPRYLLFADQILDATKYRSALSDVEEWEKARVCIKRLAESLNEGADEQINHDGLKKWIPILHQDEDGEEFLNIGKRADILGPTTRFIGEISQMRLDYDGQIDNYRVVVFNTCILFGTVRDTRFTPAFFFDTWSCLPRDDRLLSLQGTVRFADDELATHKTLCHLVDKAVARLLPADEKQRANLQTKMKDGEEIVMTLQLNLGVTQVPELVEGDYTKGGVELANQMLNDPEYLRQLEAFRAKNQPSTPRRIGRALKRAFTPSSQKLDRLRDAAVPGIHNLSPKESRIARLRKRRVAASPSPPPVRRRASIAVTNRDSSPVRTPTSKAKSRKPASAVPSRIRADRTPFQSPPASPSKKTKPTPTPKPKFSRNPSDARQTHVSTPAKQRPTKASSEPQLSKKKSEERTPKAKSRGQASNPGTPAVTPKARKAGPTKSPLSDRSNVQKPTPKKISKKHTSKSSNPTTPSLERIRT